MTDPDLRVLLPLPTKGFLLDFNREGVGRMPAFMDVGSLWRFVSALFSIGEVALHRARLVLRWVTVSVRNPGQLSLAIPPWLGAMSTGV